MPLRATKRGTARTPLTRDCDVVICGASFAGLTVARELESTGARVMLLDRYEIGERQTSACAAPTDWLTRLELRSSIRQTFDELVVHTSRSTTRWPLPFTFSTFDYPQLCGLLGDAARSCEFDTATVSGLTPGGAMHTVHTDRGDLRAPLVVDALGWRRVLGGANPPIQPPDARLSRGLEVHPHGSGGELELWIDKRYVRAGYSWSFPAGDEVRVGVGSFEPRDHVKAPTVALAGDLGLPAERYQGNWIPHQLRPATERGVFFVGDSAGHCLPLTAEGIRPAFHFAIALGRELRHVLAGRSTREQALERYRSFSAEHRWQYTAMLATQHLVGRATDSALLNMAVRAMGWPRLSRWAFAHYLAITEPHSAGRSAAIARSGRAAVPSS